MTNIRARFTTLVGAARPFVSLLVAAGRFVRRFLAWFFVAVFGRWSWQAPLWMGKAHAGTNRAFRYLGANPLHAVALMLATTFAVAGAYWLVTRPKPDYVTFSVTNPALTTYDDKGNIQIKKLVVTFSKSAAPLKLIDKAVTEGIDVSPVIQGTWTWASDRILSFTPKSDWPVDGHFNVKLAKKGVIAEHVILEEYVFAVKSQPFGARIADSQFYQDPRDPNMKKLVATVSFSHPVDAQSFERLVSLAVQKDADYLGLSPDSRHFSVVYDKLKLNAFIHSAALGMPKDDTPMTLVVDKGVRAARGGNESGDRLQAVVTIPGRASLRFSDARMTVVDNARYEPEQILLLKSSSPVVETAMAGGITVRLLPARHPKQRPEDKRLWPWTNAEEIGDDILATSEPVKIDYVPPEEGGNTSHGFKFLAPVGRWMHVVVNDGVQGVGGYVSGRRYVTTVKVEPYQPKLTFLGAGSLLSLTGDKRVGFLVRDVDGVDVEVGRVLPDQLQHLAPQMWNFAKPGIYDGLEDRIVERFISHHDYRDKQPGKPTYDSVDMAQYLTDKAQARRGLFVLRLRGVNRGIQDERLILVTDIGFIVKGAKDGSRDVFVQSIRTGLPLEGARIELTGANGQPIFAGTTTAAGRVTVPQLDPRERQRERLPTLVVVRKDEDMSFVPISFPGDRGMNLSRFDVGGVENAFAAQQLTSYLFSDRGIYRPGETTHVGVITRTADWIASLGTLPVTVEIHDPRGLIVNRTDLKLTDAAFDEVTFPTQSSSPTGTYEAIAYIVKPNRQRDTLGSTTFKVQEFEPDRLKVRLDMADADKVGAAWLKPEDVKARVAVNYLFGDAASGRRVEAELSLTPAIPRFAQFADYRFQIGEALPEPYHEQLQPVNTDDRGNADLSLDLKRFVGHAYRVNVLVRAFEAEGGRNVGAQNSAIVSSSPFLIGVKPDGDLSFIARGVARSTTFLAVNQQLAPVAADNLSLDWVQRKYVSVLSEQNDHTFRYVSRLKETVRDTKKVAVAAGGTPFALPTGEPGDFVIVLRDRSGAELNRVSYTVAGQANIARSLERNSELEVQLDKPAYSGGDTIQVSIRAPYVGAGLITVEREKVFVHQWFKTTTTSTLQKITLPADFEGNGYVSVQFLRDPSSDEIFMSPLAYGIAAFAPNLSARRQPVTLIAPKLAKPGETLTMHVAPGEASRVALLAVDEGILQVARYKNPDPLAFFFQKRMLEVDTRQILDLILPEYSRFLALAAPGGDAGGDFARQLNPFARKHKAPVAFWSGVVDVPREGRDIRYTIPDYFNGRLRIVAIAASTRRMGVAEVATEVKGDFILTPNVPETTAPGDEFAVSVGVFNNSSGSGPVRLEAKVSGGLTLMSPAQIDLTIAEKKEGVAEFRLKTNAVLGNATLTFVAHRGTAQSTNEETVGVRPPVPYRTTLALGRTDRESATATITRDLYGEHRTVEASVSALPLVWGAGLVVYLENYEYSCTEQLVSMGIGGLIVAARPEFGTVNSHAGMTGQQRLDATIAAIRGRKNDEGGVGLWASSPQTAEFATVYAAHFLIEARDHGQKIPDDALTPINSWLMRFAATPASTLSDGRMRAYAVYLLVRQGIRPNAQLANVEQELTHRYAQTYPTDLAAAYLAATYRLMQRNDDAEKLIGNVPWASQKRDLQGEVYYDGVVHDAELLYLLSKHFPNRITAVPAAPLENISAAVSGNRYTSLSAAYTLLALDAFAKQAAPAMKFAVTEIAKDNGERPLTLPASSMPKVNVSQTATTVRFSKDGPLPVYFAVSESGFDRNLPTADAGKGIEIVREYLDVNGNPLTRVAVGQEFVARVRVRATTRGFVPQIVVVDLSPGGVEPVIEVQPPPASSDQGVDPATGRQGGGAAAALPIGLPGKSNWRPYHVDVREDRLLLYGDLTKDASTFVYRLRATNAGTYQIPPAFAEGMYDRSIVGVSPAGKLEIVKP
jgi:alpha-2-macroglobulin